jgi:hypothetical protein
MKKQKSEFTAWFEAQHGKPPSRKQNDELRRDFRAANMAAAKAYDILEKSLLYDAKRHSALMAWIASEDRKNADKT